MARTLKDDHAGQLWDLVESYPGPVDDALRARLSGDVTGFRSIRPIDLTQVEPTQLEAMVDRLRAAETATRELRVILQAHLSGDQRLCRECGAAVAGKKVYCSSRCRVRHHRRPVA